MVRDYPRVEVRSRHQLRAWLQKNHKTDSAIWLVTFKKHCAEDYVSYDAIVEEALCFGWIDSTVRTLDADRLMHLLSPRRAGSTWSLANKQRLKKLRNDKLMTEVGEAKVRSAKRDGSWMLLDDVEKLIVPEELALAFAKNRAAAQHYEAFTRGEKKILLWWIKSAKRPETREKRIAATVRAAAKGELATG